MQKFFELKDYIFSKGNKLKKNPELLYTNSQTAIKKEQLEALSAFQKNLEEFYKYLRTADIIT